MRAIQKGNEFCVAAPMRTEERAEGADARRADLGHEPLPQATPRLKDPDSSRPGRRSGKIGPDRTQGHGLSVAGCRLAPLTWKTVPACQTGQ